MPRPIIQPLSLDSPLLASMGIRDREMLARLRVKSPMLLALGLEPITTSQTVQAQQQDERAARVGRDRGVVDLADFGPGLRMEAVCGPDGAVLREADVGAADEWRERELAPDDGRKIIRRARRCDPLSTLLKYGSVDQRQFDAAEALRWEVEAATPKMGGSSTNEVHASPWQRTGVTTQQIDAVQAVREACASVPPEHRLAVAWIVVGGGTVSGLGHYLRCNTTKVSVSLRAGLSALADHFEALEDRAA